ncbi:unnamed protein product [Wuchereria bancrofti]|uniref:Uncharacterized protein n=1 Tax=Wuchereria bancrofti TaxID=6293 RepID=A0A3P7ED30_WUCBA|nr:unnamed protein product [Wuchereria bancrofti]
MGSSTVSGITSLSLYWFISTIIIWICKKGTRRKERLESLAHRGKMDKLEQLRRLRDDEASKIEKRCHLFSGKILYNLRDQTTFYVLARFKIRKYKRPNKQELKDVKHVDAKSIRDVLRKRLKGEEINSLYQRQNDIASYQSDKVNRQSGRRNSQLRNYNYKSHRSRRLQKMKKEASKTKSFRAKLRELSMSPRTRRKVELEIREQEISPKKKKLIRHRVHTTNRLLISPRRLLLELPLSEESLLTACQGVVSTAHAEDQDRSLSERIRKNRKSHQTARSIVEEDLKQRLQQDFKLAPAKIPEARSERSKTSDDRFQILP